MSDLAALLDTPYFRAGLRLGIAALAVGWALRFAIGRDRPPLPIHGLLLAGAALGGLYLTGEEMGPLVPAVGAIVAGVLLTRLPGIPAWTAPLAAAPGAIWLAVATPATNLTWVRVLMAILIPLGGYLLSDFELRHDKMGLGVVFFTLACLGMFAAVPDTEQALIIAAAALATTLLAWPFPAASVGPEGGYAVIAVFMVITAMGGEGRPSSIIGSAACLGLLLLEPLIVRLRPGAIKLLTWVNRNWVGAVLASLPQFVLVVLCSRVAARFQTETPAIVIVALVYGATLVGGFLAARRVAETPVG